jgi:hypothetical protein
MKNLFTLACCVLLYSCAIVSPKLTGSYQDSPFVVYSDKSKDDVWSKVIDVFAQKGITINVIDKSSGLIVSSAYSFINKYAFEENGQPQDPNAWVVVNFYGLEGTKQSVLPTSIKGNFNVRLKEENGKTSINVNLTNLEASMSNSAGGSHVFEAKSTGIFEREIAEMIK